MRVWPRFFFTEFAFASVFIAQGAFVIANFASGWVKKISSRKISPNLLFYTGAVVLLTASMVMSVRNYTMPKQNFTAPLEVLFQESASSKSIGVIGWAHVPYIDFYKKDWKQLYTAADLDSLNPSNGGVWVIAAFPARTSRANADIWAILERDFVVAGAWPGSLGDGRVILFRSKDQSSDTSVR